MISDKTKKRKSTLRDILPHHLSTHQPKQKIHKVSLNGNAPPLGKFLASNNKATRDLAVDGLRKFLGGKVERIDEIFQAELSKEFWETIPSQDERLDSIELAKVYKGLFYCYWMSDKPIIQQELANELAGLSLITIPKKLSNDNSLNQVFITQTCLSFWKAFWKTLQLEWPTIDKHRQDKYLLLMRRYLGVAFKILQRVDWHPKAIMIWSDILKETVFNVADFKSPLSITYHCSEIFLEELDRVLETKPEPKAPIDQLLIPLVYGLSQSRAGTATFKNIVENVFDPIFENLEYFRSNRTKKLKSNTITIYNSFENSLRLSTGSNHHDLLHPSIHSSNQLHLIQIRAGILSLLFNAGADPLCSDSNRKKIYNYWNLNRGSDDDDDDDHHESKVAQTPTRGV